jgi:kynurenine formamidase
MEMIDLSRDLFHRTQTHPAHPPVIISVWYDHAEKKRAGNTDFSSKALSIAFSDHAGTHVDAPVHFDSRPDALSIDQRNSIRPAFVLICPTYRCVMPRRSGKWKRP